jgi:class I fructose-bisphosphate aldolase
MTSSIQDALRLGCCAVGVTIYPGSDDFYNAIDEIREVILEAKSCGLAVVVWSYPRGEGISKEGETAIDVCSYAGHIAALIGANIIKLKPPSNFIEKPENLKIYQENHIQTATLAQRVAQVMKSVFNGKRLVVFSGLAKKSDEDLLAETAMLNEAGASGSIIGRNSFQRPFNKSVELLQRVCQIYGTDV